MMVYEASPARAYQSVLNIEENLRFGGLVRNVHYLSSHLLIAVTTLHMLRVFFTGAFRGPRSINWIVGILLVVCVMAANFTGYLLPWDQLSFWAVTICTSMLKYIPIIGEQLLIALRGGAEVGAPTLVIFYAFHTTVLPTAIVLLMGYHFFRVRVARGVIHPFDEKTDVDQVERVLVWPHLLLRELSVGLTVMAIVLGCAVFIDAPIGPSANTGMSPNPAKAPWYFVGFQELQLHLHPTFAVVIIPLLLIIMLLFIPYTKQQNEQAGRWFLSAPGRRTALISALGSAAMTTAFILIDEMWLLKDAGLATIAGRGIIPLVFVAALFYVARLLLARALNMTKLELNQATFTAIFMAFVVLTITGAWFRGPNMALVWPFAN